MDAEIATSTSTTGTATVATRKRNGSHGMSSARSAKVGAGGWAHSLVLLELPTIKPAKGSRLPRLNMQPPDHTQPRHTKVLKVLRRFL